MNHVKDVNRIIKKAFGRLYRGDYEMVSNRRNFSSTRVVKSSLYRDYKLGIIATKFTVFDPGFGGGVRGVLSKDGSTIAVIKRFEFQAQKYAELYQKKFGREVRVYIVEDFHDLFPELEAISMRRIPIDANNLPV